MAAPGSELRHALASCRGAFLAAAGFSFFINLLMLVSPLYMMQVYNRVLPSRSDSTLIVLTALACGLLLVMALLEGVRARVMVRVSGRLNERLDARILAAIFQSALRSSRHGGAQGVRDFDSVRQFLTGAGAFAFFDAPWTPLMILVIYAFHPVLGMIAAGGAVVLLVLAVLNELATRRVLDEAGRKAIGVNGFVDSSVRNAEVLHAMGMFGNLVRHWSGARDDVLGLQAAASDRAATLSALTRFARVLLQTAMLGAGAWLAIRNEITPGVIIASSVVVGRALAPVETAIGSWKQFIGARAAYHRLHALLAQFPATARRTSLPPAEGRLDVEALTVVPPGAERPSLMQVDLSLAPGEVLGVIGPSGAGKSTLVRAIVGAWVPLSGHIRLDGADVQDWNRDELGPQLGYLPQDVELFDGTVGENIARFGAVDSAALIAAAQRAGVHEMVLRLPRGYDTQIGPGGSALSGGQRQRIGLARALYGAPRFLVLDEPNSNLDEDGESALVAAIAAAKGAGATVVVVSHRPSLLGVLDKLLVLVDGTVRAFGPRAEVVARLGRRPAPVERESLIAQRAS